ncbi:MAG TPA: LysR family transcriptional regulator [Devosia sp.]|nr:LysR family transcriptional regulator [Devosia sp.]
MHDGEIDWSLWRSFAAVVRHGSLSGAARKLDLSQPTLGRHIQSLETRLDTTLFTRTRKGLEPTPRAMRLFEQVDKAHRSLNEAAIQAQGANSQMRGTVRMTASTVTCHYVLPSILKTLRREHPAIQLELVASDSTENLLMREADIAIRMFRPTQLELITRKIGESPITCCAHKDYLDTRGTPETINDIFSHDLVGFDKSDLLISSARALGFALKREDFVIRTDSQTAIWEMIRTGLGIGFAQTMLVQQTPGMRAIIPQLRIPPLEIWLTTHKELFTNRRIRAIYDRLADLLADSLSPTRASPGPEGIRTT